MTPQTKTTHPFLSAISGILAPLTFLILLCVALSFLVPNFNTRDNYKIIAIQAAVVAILACGQTAVIISGNIDLSVGAVMALSGVAAAQAMVHHNTGVAGGVLNYLVSGFRLGTLTGLITAFG